MKKNVLVFGTIAGVLVSSFMFFSMLFFKGNHNFDYSMVIGYASMLVAFSFIFVAIKNYRDNFNNGLVTFGKAFMIGLYVALIGSTFYVVTWMIEFHYFMPDFLDLLSEYIINKAKESGETTAQINAKAAQLAEYKEVYKNPVLMALVTYMEVLPVGLLVSLISAFILKKKNNNINQPQAA